MSFKVSFNSGTGNDDLDEENEAGKHGFSCCSVVDIEAERKAFLLGVNMTDEGFAEFR